MIPDQIFAVGNITLADVLLGMILIIVSATIDWRIKGRRMQQIKYSMATNIENMTKIFSQTSKYTQSIMDDPDGELWINYLKKYMEINRDTVQNYYDQMQVNFKEIDTSKKKYAVPIKIIINNTEWLLYNFYNRVLATNESNIREYRILGTKFNKHCSEFFENADKLQENGEINYKK